MTTASLVAFELCAPVICAARTETRDASSRNWAHE